MNKRIMPEVIGIAVIIIFAIFVTGCTQNYPNNQNMNGTLSGKITIGPLCPVEHIPPDPACQPTQATYNAWPIFVYTSDKIKVLQIMPNLDGTYNVELAPGRYIVDLENLRASPIAGRSNLPANMTINPGETSYLDINIDTGIR